MEKANAKKNNVVRKILDVTDFAVFATEYAVTEAISGIGSTISYIAEVGKDTVKTTGEKVTSTAQTIATVIRISGIINIKTIKQKISEINKKIRQKIAEKKFKAVKKILIGWIDRTTNCVTVEDLDTKTWYTFEGDEIAEELYVSQVIAIK